MTTFVGHAGHAANTFLMSPFLCDLQGLFSSVLDPDPPDSHVFGHPGSGSTSQKYGSVSEFFYHHAKIIRKSLIPSTL